VYAPLANPDVPEPGVEVCRLPGRFGPRSLSALDWHLARQPRPDRILVQYSPPAFGWKAMNVPFAAWIATRARRIAPMWVMFHEVAFPFSWRPKHAVLGVATRLTARLVAGAADRVFVSIPVWGDLLQRICPRVKRSEWLPVPCTLAIDSGSDEASAMRARFAAEGEFLVGHFGTFGPLITEVLVPAITALVEQVPRVKVVFIGRGSAPFRDRLAAAHPALAPRMFATGGLPDAAVSAHLRACDLLLQPFPDGISSRRTTAMAGLANGVPVVTNLGPLSESFWGGGAVAVTLTPDAAAVARLASGLLTDPAARAELGRRGAELYRTTFALEHTIAKLRRARV
jgi:glycosyltransferase involved in cell wall biosynthesis